MLNKGILYAFLSLGSLVVFSIAGAAELRGRLSGIPDALVEVSCHGGGGRSTVDKTGNYAVRGLPSSRDCSFTVSGGGAKSVSIPFSTTRSVTIYSGKLRRHNGRILVSRQ